MGGRGGKEGHGQGGCRDGERRGQGGSMGTRGKEGAGRVPLSDTPSAETHSKLRTLERASKSLKSEKSILQEEIASLRLAVSEKDKDTRGVKGQLQEVQDEVMKLTTKLSDMRSQKVKFSRLAREKGEEIGECVRTGLMAVRTIVQTRMA